MRRWDRPEPAADRTRHDVLAPAVAWRALPSSTDQREPRRGDMRQAHDAEAAHFQQAGQPGRRPGYAVVDVHPIVGDQIEAACEQAQQQIGFARTWWADQQHAVACSAGAAPVGLHNHALSGPARRKGSRLSPAGAMPASPP